MEQPTNASLVKTYPWQEPVTFDGAVMKALGFVRVSWPSGRQTLEMYAGDVAMTTVEQARAYSPDRLRAQKEENLLNSLAEFRARTDKTPWFIRSKRRRPRARRIISAEWIHPDRYDGPRPDGHGVIA